LSGSDVIVLGGGIIGLGVAWELARRGAQVTLLERDAPARAASWAAAGMLAPRTEQIADAPLRALALESLRLYPDFAADLLEASGIDIHLRLHGILDLRPLADEPRSAVFSPDEGQVDNRLLGRALTEAADRAGVRIRRNCAATALVCSARRVTGVQTEAGFLAASSVVNALGAWAGALPGVPEPFTVPVRPVKGQICAVQTPPGYLRCVVWMTGGLYLVPRDDGRLLVGATVEERGFDDRVTAGGIHHLMSGLLRVMPGAANFAIGETWAGLRPDTPDGRPYIGLSELEGYVLATGHYRNGILLAPVTARCIADAITGKRWIDSAFAPERGLPLTPAGDRTLLIGKRTTGSGVVHRLP
jgi:glycine oxidase